MLKPHFQQEESEGPTLTGRIHSCKEGFRLNTEVSDKDRWRSSLRTLCYLQLPHWDKACQILISCADLSQEVTTALSSLQPLSFELTLVSQTRKLAQEVLGDMSSTFLCYSQVTKHYAFLMFTWKDGNLVWKRTKLENTQILPQNGMEVNQVSICHIRGI